MDASTPNWRSQFMPAAEELDESTEEPLIEEQDESETSELGHVWQEGITGTDRMGDLDEERLESLRADVMGGDIDFQSALVDLGNNQQRIMMAIDQMASGFSSTLNILARRIDNFERILEQSQGQPPMTNLMYDAPEVFNKIVQREIKAESESARLQDIADEYNERFDEPAEVGRAIEPRAPEPNFEIPDEIEHLLNFDATFPVSVEVQTAFHMWKAKKGTFQDFVKAAGGPVPAKKARGHLE